MINFNVQLNSDVNEIKTLHEIVEEAFSTKKPVVDVSFFYNEKHDSPRPRDVREDKVKLPDFKR